MGRSGVEYENKLECLIRELLLGGKVKKVTIVIEYESGSALQGESSQQ